MASMDSEQIVLLNDDWQPIGVAPKLASHHAETPLHLAFSCYVFNDAGEILVTRRATTKKVWPGIWTNSCCGHPAPEETMEAAIVRRLDYELGMTVTDLELIIPDFRYRCEFNGIVENECCPVYVAHASSEVRPNPEEVEDYRWMSWQDFTTELQDNSDAYSYWSKLQVPLLVAKGVGAPQS